MPDSDPIEDAITTVVDAEAVFAMPEMDENLLIGFVTDIAQAIHPMDVISRRYGFATPRQMVKLITDNREIRRRIKAKRAVWESDANAGERIQHYSQHSVLEVLPQTSRMMTDASISPQTRLDALKVHARMAGVDGTVSAGAAAKDAGRPGSAFVVNFMFSGDRTQTIAGTVVEVAAETAPGLPPPKPPLMPDLGSIL